MEPKYDIEVSLVGEDGNVFTIISRVSRALKNSIGVEASKQFEQDAFASFSYEEVLRLCMNTVHVT